MDGHPQLFETDDFEVPETSYGEWPALTAEDYKVLADDCHDNGNFAAADHFWSKAETAERLQAALGAGIVQLEQQESETH